MRRHCLYISLLLALCLQAFGQAFSFGQIFSYNGNDGYRARVNTDGTVYFLDRGAANLLTTTTPLTAGAWHQVVCIGDSSGLHIYYDGELSREGGSAFGGGVAGFALIGREATAEWLIGKLDDVRVYGRALNATERENLFNWRP